MAHRTFDALGRFLVDTVVLDIDRRLVQSWPAAALSRPYRERVSRAASKSTSITRCGSVYIGVWSTGDERILAPIRSAMKRWVFGLIMRSSSASKNHDGFVFHAGTGDASSMH